MSGTTPPGDRTATPDGLASDPTLPSGDTTATPRPVELRRVSRDDYVRGPELARGGMGRIVAARDVRHDRPVALKELLHHTPALVARFQREAMIAARLQHPSIIPIYEAGVWDTGEPFFAMKRVVGRALDALIAERKTPRERLSLLRNVIAATEALAYAHARGVIHRDLKPHNVLVGDYGETVVIDWGLAKDIGASSGDDALVETADVGSSEIAPAANVSGDLTVAGQALGTPAYMPPEQARGDEVDVRADVYALGAMLYHVLSGAVPHANAGLRGKALLVHIEQHAPRPLVELAPGLPADLLAIVDKAMARNPGDRYGDAGEMAADLHRFEAGQLVSAHDYSVGALLARWARRHKVLLSAAALFVVASAAGLFVYVRAINAKEAVAQRERRRAEQSLATAQTRTARLYEEQGRSRLAAAQPLQALAYLGKSYAMGNDNVSLRYLIARASTAVSGIAIAAEDEAYDAAFTPDGARIALSGPKGVIIVDAHSGREVSRFFGTSVTKIALAQRRPLLIAGEGESGVARIIDPTDGRLLVTLEPLPHITGVALDADGTVAATVTYESVLRISDARTGLTRWSRPVAETTPKVELSPDGAYVSTCDQDFEEPSTDNVVCSIRSVTDGRVLRTVATGIVRFSPRLGVIVELGKSRGGAAIADLNGANRTELEGAAGHVDGAFSADGSLLATISTEGSATVWDVATGKRVNEFYSDDRAFIWKASFGSHGTLVVSDNFLHVKVWDIRRHVVLAELRGAGGRAARLSPDGTQLVTAHGRPAMLWSIDRIRRSLVIPQTKPAQSIDFSPDGKRVATAATDGVRVWDAHAGTLLATLSNEASGSVSFSPDGSRIAVAGASTVIRDSVTGEIRMRFDQIEKPTVGVQLAADLLLTESVGKSQVWDLRDGALVQDVDRVWSALSSDGKRLISSGEDGLEMRTVGGGVEATLPAPQSNWIALSGDGATVVSSGPTVWHLPTKSQPFRFEATTRGFAGAMTRDGALVATAAEDGVWIWDGSSGRVIDILGGGEEHVTALRFSPDGSRLAAASYEGVVQIWDTHLETRTPVEVDALMAKQVPWRVDERGLLVTASRTDQTTPR